MGVGRLWEAGGEKSGAQILCARPESRRGKQNLHYLNLLNNF